jgi:hypothetical protein
MFIPILACMAIPVMSIEAADGNEFVAAIAAVMVSRGDVRFAFRDDGGGKITFGALCNVKRNGGSHGQDDEEERS